jgi:hypothetical protein
LRLQQAAVPVYAYLVEPPGDGEVPAGPLEEAPPVPLGVEPVVSLPGVVPPLVPPGGVVLLLLLLLGGELGAPPGGVLVLPAVEASPPPAAPVPLVPAAPGALAVPDGLLGLVDGGVAVLALPLLLLGLAVPAAGDV